MGGILGLVYKYKNQIYLSGNFNIIFVSKHGNVIYVEDYPAYFLNQNETLFNRTGFCVILNYTKNNEQLSRNCRLSYLIKRKDNSETAFKTNNIELNKMVVFEYNSKKNILKEKLLISFWLAFKKSHCLFVEISLVTKEIQYIQNMKEIFLIFNGVALKLPKESMYEHIKENQNYRLLFIFSSEVKVNMIGQVLFNNYEVLFDEKLRRVRFQIDKLNMMGNATKYT